MKRKYVKFNIILFLIASLFVCEDTFAQRQRRGIQQLSPKDEMVKDEMVKNDMITIEEIENEDSALYAKIVRKNGWWNGVGKELSKEQAQKLPYYYKFSRKNKSGNWTLVQAFDGYGNLTTEGFNGNYLIKNYDEADVFADEEWQKELRTICQFYFVGDNEVFQERALNSNNEIIYCFNPKKIADREIIGSYSDAFGRLFKMRKEDEDLQANYVRIIRDKQGYDSLVYYTNQDGYMRLSRDGAPISKYLYDRNGNNTLIMSLNYIGEASAGNWGYCGVNIEYDKNNNRTKYMRFDVNGQPVRCPGIRGTEPKVYGSVYKYDRYGRLIEEMFIDGSGNVDSTEYGVSYIRSKYNEYGKLIEMSTHDINNNLKAGYFSPQIAKWTRSYNDNGLQIEYSAYDSNGNLVPGIYEDNTIIVRVLFEYDKNGNKVKETRYDQEGIYRETIGDGRGNAVTRWYRDGDYRVDSVDTKGREILSAFYLDNNTPTEYSYHKRITKYTEEDGIYIKEYSTYDKNGNCNTKEITYIDSLKLEWWKRKNGKDLTIKYLLDGTTFETKGIMRISPDGEPMRNAYDDWIYYSCDIKPHMLYKTKGQTKDKSIGKNSSISDSLKNDAAYTDIYMYRNEFGEYAYKTAIDLSDAYSISIGDDNLYFDESCNILVQHRDSLKNFVAKLPKAYCIEVVDTLKTSTLGVKNGDIILKYGDWTVNQDLITDMDYYYLETILKTRKEKMMTVLRHFPKENKSEIVEISLGKGNPSDFGFYVHKICYTQKEKQRLHDIAKFNSFAFGEKVLTDDTRTITIMVPLKGSEDKSKIYNKCVKSPSLLISLIIESIRSWNDFTCVLHNNQYELDWIMANQLRDDLNKHILFSDDLISNKSYKEKKIENLKLITLQIPLRSKDVWNSFLENYKSNDDILVSELWQCGKNILPKKKFKNGIKKVLYTKIPYSLKEKIKEVIVKLLMNGYINDYEEQKQWAVDYLLSKTIVNTQKMERIIVLDGEYLFIAEGNFITNDSKLLYEEIKEQ